jgi:hypothetical protein
MLWDIFVSGPLGVVLGFVITGLVGGTILWAIGRLWEKITGRTPKWME